MIVIGLVGRRWNLRNRRYLRYHSVTVFVTEGVTTEIHLFEKRCIVCVLRETAKVDRCTMRGERSFIV